ncbi:(4Fe-4S)-binding protein [Algoriphagus mannitolivorans]|uniref:(4Fe-4S)-binding protein n=1 Tax=Algoriphagus mannitolivorans TaxID=226504 RepID=UPI000411F3AD|nr:(4Fe-4S)-binding protein [Algoriphagus mannitolivorans]
MKNEKKEYSNGEVTITWESHKCIHSGNCARGLPKVFNPKHRPWISVDGASSEEMVNQVKKCPSGALGYYYQ